jgi:hypothetical protein
MIVLPAIIAEPPTQKQFGEYKLLIKPAPAEQKQLPVYIKPCAIKLLATHTQPVEYIPVSVPNDVKLEAVTWLFKVDPHKLPAGIHEKFDPLNVGLAPLLMFCGKLIVTPPVDALTETWLAVPDKLVTPAFVSVTELPKATVPPPPKPVPAETVIELLINAPFGMQLKLPPQNVGAAPLEIVCGKVKVILPVDALTET